MSQAPYNDPFAEPDRHPAVSWVGAPAGATITGTVIDLPRDVQARDFATGKAETWDDGNPKWNVVIGLDINGEKRSLWAMKPSAMFAALKEAIKQTQPGYVELGGTFQLTYTGDKPPERPGMNPARQFSVVYRPPNPFGGNGSAMGQQQGQQQAPYSPQQPNQGAPQQGQSAPQSWQPAGQPAGQGQPVYQQGSNPQPPQGNDPWAPQQQPDEPPF